MEARDGNGITTLLEFQLGTVRSNDFIEVGMSWRPAEEGNYQLRTFLISGFERPEIISGVRTSDVIVTD
jgi:hypothetical protein